MRINAAEFPSLFTSPFRVANKAFARSRYGQVASPGCVAL